MTKIIKGTYKYGSVFIKQVNVNETIEKEIIDINIIGSVSIDSNIDGYVILCNDCSLFIPENPAFATTELLKVLIAAINQLCVVIDTNLSLIATGITSAGGSYVPGLTNIVMQPVIQAMTQLQQTTSTKSNTKLPDIPLPKNIKELNSVEIEDLIQEQKDKINLLNKTLGIVTSNVNQVLEPIKNIIDLIDSFSNPALNNAKASVQQAKDYENKLEDEKIKKQKEEQGE